MKKYFSILFALAAFALVSCQKEAESTYEPGTPDPSDCYGVYFPVQDASGPHTYDPSMDRSVSIKVTRTNTSGAITVPFTTTVSEENVFKFGTIEFADGQSETELEVTFPTAEEGKELSFSIQLTDDTTYISNYGSGAIALDFSVLCVELKDFMTEDGSKKAMLTFTDDVFWGEVHDDVYLQYYEVDGVRYCTTSGGKLVSPLDGGSDGAGPWGTDVQLSFKWYTNVKMEIEGVEYDFIEVLPQYHGWYNETRASEVWFADYYNYYQNNASTPYDGDAIKFFTNNGASYPPCYYDGHGGFIFNLAYYMPTSGGYWYGFNLNAPVAIAEGYLRVDYSLEVKTDYPDGGVTPVLFTVGADVDKVKYAVYEGSLNSVQVQARIDAIVAGEEENVETVDEFEYDENEEVYYAYVGVSPESTGEYTLVAVAYNKKSEEVKEVKDRSYADVTFNHIIADDDANYEVTVSVFTEDTPERYQQLHAYDSFAYGISGKDLTEVHVAFYTAEDVSKYGVDAVVADAKADADGKYAVSEDVLAEINADGGYYTVATKLAPKTTYYVVVWATNGSKEGVASDSYTTEKLPYVWNSLGKGTITDGFCVYLFGKEDITATCDVYQEQNNPGLYMITGYQLSIVSQFFGMTEDDLRPYEGGNWNNTEVIIDASDPDAVFIEEQDYGVCVNGQYGFFQIETEKSGTLKDGVITWPAEEMYIGLPGLGKWYYTNDEGTFSITLPSAVPSGAPAKVASASNGEVKDCILTTSQKGFPFQTVVYEREVKSISVETKTLSYEGNAAPKAKAEKVESRAFTPSVK